MGGGGGGQATLMWRIPSPRGPEDKDFSVGISVWGGPSQHLCLECGAASREFNFLQGKDSVLFIWDPLASGAQCGIYDVLSQRVSECLPKGDRRWGRGGGERGPGVADGGGAAGRRERGQSYLPSC